MRLMTRVFLILVAVYVTGATASLVQPGDGPYYRSPQERILYIYDQEGRESATPLSGYMRRIRDEYDRSFGWQLDEQEDLILASPNQQVANAFATVVPNIKSFWFPSGAGALEEMAGSSWALTLATHETSHLYQMDAKGGLNSALKRVFGNAITVTPFLWPIFIHPNLFDPTFLVEGNAVFNESRAGIGGRLYSGEVRAIVLAQIKAGEIDPTRLINDEFRFPYGANPYQQGGYFQAHLAAKYGVDKTNQFFVAQGDHYLWPLVLNKTFRDHFGASYPQEIREYTREMQGLAAKQVEGEGQRIAKGEFISPLNQDDDSIYFLATDGLEFPELTVFDKRTGKFTHEHRDIPFGKLFPESDRWLAATSEQHDLHHIEYSLYGEGHAFIERFRGQIVTDRRAGKTVALDARSTWLQPRVLVDGAPYDAADSNPILDSQGGVYYFRQNGAVRVLYRNREPVFKYDGFYGKLTEVGPDGTIYFVANTDYGSTLYRYKNSEITRVLASDRVVDARRIDDSRFLAVEVNPNGHTALVETAEPKPANPATYSYGFPSYSLQPGPSADIAAREGSYNSLSELRYSGLDFASTFDNHDGLGLSVGANFVDPLEYNELSLLYSGATRSTQSFAGQYTFTKYLPQFFARYAYQRDLWTQVNSVARVDIRHEGLLGVDLPLLRWRHWDAKWTAAATYDSHGNRFDPSAPVSPTFINPQGQTYGVYNHFHFQFLEQPEPAISYYPWRQWTLDYFNHLDTASTGFHKQDNTSMVESLYQRGFPDEVYATVSGGAAWAETHDVRVYYNPQPVTVDIMIPRLTSHEDFSVMRGAFARFELAKVAKLQLYSPRIPVGLERVAPFLVGQGIVLDDQGNNYGLYAPNTFEWGYGFDLQLLLLHKLHAKLRLLNAYDTRHPVSTGEKQAQFAMRYDF